MKETTTLPLPSLSNSLKTSPPNPPFPPIYSNSCRLCHPPPLHSGTHLFHVEPIPPPHHLAYMRNQKAPLLLYLGRSKSVGQKLRRTRMGSTACKAEFPV